MTAVTPSGWADDRLMQAYDLIGAVLSDAREAGIFDVAKALKQAEVAVENADIALQVEREAQA